MSAAALHDMPTLVLAALPTHCRGQGLSCLMLPAGFALTCICQEQAVSWEGCRVACQGLMQQLIFVLLCQLPVQPQHSHPAVLDLGNGKRHIRDVTQAARPQRD